MSFDHETLVWISKTYGLIYLMIFSLVVVVYAYWPSKKQEFDDAARSVLEEEERPWQ